MVPHFPYRSSSNMFVRLHFGLNFLSDLAEEGEAAEAPLTPPSG